MLYSSKNVGSYLHFLWNVFLNFFLRDYSAAKYYEAAGKAENGRKNYEIAAELYKKASEYYCNSQNNERMAEVLVVGAK